MLIENLGFLGGFVDVLVTGFSHQSSSVFFKFLIRGVALTLRISIIFLIGHFLIFTVLDIECC
ncbi:unnamed protein product [Onchocerca flexuosa]|uniref:Uncharacterized protein n=1 Tax=Onchocerca flexuosa TaxID=387005 RepID=A0A183HU94_9BILA|nr:unnamed protein product [Onchocerca flexuosa]